jgi:hypothetical protein
MGSFSIYFVNLHFWFSDFLPGNNDLKIQPFEKKINNSLKLISGVQSSPSLCFNDNSTFGCGCPHGLEEITLCMWETFTNKTCITFCGDFDECADPDRCDHTSTASDSCDNTYGSYVCSCGAGYVQITNFTEGISSEDHENTLYSEQNYFGCEDIDECSNKTAHCDVNSNCTNSIGSFSCACDSAIYIDTYGNVIV